MWKHLGALGALALGGCVQTVAPSHITKPADATISGPPIRYGGVLAGIKKYDVVEPKDWRELNRAVGPQSGQGGGMEGMGMGNGRRDTGGR